MPVRFPENMFTISTLQYSVQQILWKKWLGAVSCTIAAFKSPSYSLKHNNLPIVATTPASARKKQGQTDLGNEYQPLINPNTTTRLWMPPKIIWHRLGTTAMEKKTKPLDRHKRHISSISRRRRHFETPTCHTFSVVSYHGSFATLTPSSSKRI